MTSITDQINFLAAIRCGEIHPPMLARTIATLDHMLNVRLTLNIISSDLPGTYLSSEERYSRSKEVIEIHKSKSSLKNKNLSSFGRILRMTLRKSCSKKRSYKHNSP